MTAPYTIAVLIAGTAVDTDGIEWTMTGTYGRQTLDSECSPQTVTLTLAWAVPGLPSFDPALVAPGVALTVRLTLADASVHDYFVGQITDPALGRYVVTITAVAYALSQLGRTQIDAPANTGATSGDAVQAVFDLAAGAGFVTFTADPGTVTVTNDATPNVAALAALATIIGSEPGGVLIQNGPASVRFCDYNARRLSDLPTSDLFAFATADGWSKDWGYRRSIGDLVNNCPVTWTGGIETYTDAASVAVLGLASRPLSTILDSSGDAAYLATRTVQHNVAPGWRSDGRTLRLDLLDTADLAQVLDHMRTGAWITVPDDYPGSPTACFVEGWTDTLTPNRWLRGFHLTDVRNSQAAQRWIDVVSGVTWATVPAGYRWVDLEGTNV